MSKVSIFLLLITNIVYQSVSAEVITDGSVGKQVNLKAPDYQITQDLGKRVGDNLFHSFDSFSIFQGESATFSGDNDISNVISRVTGGTPSTIDGILRNTIPNSNTYFINPAGVLFGENAQLDVQGSFHVSTADYLRLGENDKFYANLSENSVLSIASPTAFGFLDNDNGNITLNDTKIIADKDSIISIIGGNIEARNLYILANSGRLNVASVAAKGEVSSFLKGDLSLSGQGGDIFAQDSTLDVSGAASGNIYIRAGHFTADNAFLSSTTGRENGGKIDISADEMTVTNNTEITTLSIAENGGNSGNIIINVENLTVENGSVLQTTTFGTGQGGNITIQATDTIILSGHGTRGQGSAILSDTLGLIENAGSSGIIELRSKNLYLRDGAMLTSSTGGQGQGGKILLKVSDNISLSGEDGRGKSTGIYTTSGGVGNSGTVLVESGELRLEDGARIGADTLYARSGDVIIHVSGKMHLSGNNTSGWSSSISSNTQGSGQSGKITVKSKELHLLDGAQLATATFNSGQGGKIIVNADQLVISGFENDEYSSGIFSIAKNTGNAGTILVKANTLRVNNRGEINAGTSGLGLGGNVDIQANRIILTDNALISAISKGEGDAGQVTVQVGDTLFLLNNSAIETSTQGADGGNISLDSRSYALLINSKITTSVHSAEGDGGNILMNPEFIVMDNGKIIARAVEGRGGNIDINTTGIYRFSQKSSSSIDASSRVGIDGEVSIESPDVDISGNLIVLSADMLNAVGQLQAPCSVQLTKNKSSFIVKPFVGSSASPQDWHSNILVLIPKDEKHSTDLKEKLSATTINMKKNAKITCSNSFIQ